MTTRKKDGILRQAAAGAATEPQLTGNVATPVGATPKEQAMAAMAGGSEDAADNSAVQRMMYRVPGSQRATTEASAAADNGAQAPTYLAKWDAGFLPTLNSDAGKQIPIVQAIADYNKWANDSGNEPLDMVSTMAALQGRDPNKSVADNEEEEKKAKRNEMWERIGNVLSHIGNFVGTTAYGAPSQQLETGQQLTTRQQQLRDATLALRDKRGATLMDAYMKDLARKKDANAQYIAQRKLALEEKKQELQEERALAKDKMDAMELDAKIDKIKAEIDRINKLTGEEVKVKRSQAYKNYTSGGRNRGQNSNEYKKELDEDFVRLAEEYEDELIKYEEKYGIGEEAWDSEKKIKKGGKRWDDNLKRQFVSEMKRKKENEKIGW